METSAEPRESFEDVFDRLQQKVAGLEEGGLTLEESLACFEEGMRLAERCLRILDQAELRVTRLLAEGDAESEADE